MRYSAILCDMTPCCAPDRMLKILLILEGRARAQHEPLALTKATPGPPFQGQFRGLAELTERERASRASAADTTHDFTTSESRSDVCSLMVLSSASHVYVSSDSPFVLCFVVGVVRRSSCQCGSCNWRSQRSFEATRPETRRSEHNKRANMMHGGLIQ